MYTCIGGMRRQEAWGRGHPVTQDRPGQEGGGWMGGGGEISGFMANTEYMSENPPPTPTPIPAFGSGVVGRGGGKRGEGGWGGVEMGGGGGDGGGRRGG